MQKKKGGGTVALKKSMKIGKRGFKTANDNATDAISANAKIWTDKFLKSLTQNEEPISTKVKKVREQKTKLKKVKTTAFKENYLTKRNLKEKPSGGKSIFSGFWDFIIEEIALAFHFKDPESSTSPSTHISNKTREL